MNQYSSRQILAAARKAGLQSQALDSLATNLWAKRNKVPKIPRAVARNISELAAREGRGVFTYNARKNRWKVFTLKGHRAATLNGHRRGMQIRQKSAASSPGAEGTH